MSLCVSSLRGTAWGSRSFFHQLNPCWFLQPEVTGTYLPGSGTLGWMALSGAGTPHSWDIPPEFYPPQVNVGPACSAPTTSLDGWGFFNSIVVRLPFNLISDGSECCLFYILVAILIRLCEQGSHVYLCCHLNQNVWYNSSPSGLGGFFFRVFFLLFVLGWVLYLLNTCICLLQLP